MATYGVFAAGDLAEDMRAGDAQAPFTIPIY
jgi:hypothetical protein